MKRSEKCSPENRERHTTICKHSVAIGMALMSVTGFWLSEFPTTDLFIGRILVVSFMVGFGCMLVALLALAGRRLECWAHQQQVELLRESRKERTR